MSETRKSWTRTGDAIEIAWNPEFLREGHAVGFRTASRSVLLVVADPEKRNEVLVTVDKANGTPLNSPALRFRIKAAAYEVEEIDSAGVVRTIPASCSVAELVGEEAGGATLLAPC